MARLRTPRLDFVVIGAQKSGTTSLWRYLEDNPSLCMPPAKEAPYFTTPAYPHDLRAFMRAVFKHAPPRARVGKVTPAYMLGVPGVPVTEVARRIRATAPDVRLVALLRDPVERAFSAHRMRVARGIEQRTFEEAVQALLEPSALERSRRDPDKNTYVVGGEYGRILESYLDVFPREQLHVETTADLEQDPAAVVGRICAFLGVKPHVPQAIGERFHPTGRPRLDPAGERDLRAYLERHVWPRTQHPDQHRDSFDEFFTIWNTVAEAPAEPLVESATTSRLREHYAGDAMRLEAIVGRRVLVRAYREATSASAGA